MKESVETFSTLKLISTSKLTFDQDNPQAQIPQARDAATKPHRSAQR